MARYKQPARGDNLRDISAGGLRAAINAGEAHESGKFSGGSGVRGSEHSGSLFVINDTGKDLPRHSVVGIDAPLALPDFDEDNPQDETKEQVFLSRNAMKVVLPTVQHHWHSFGITQHAIPKEGTGKVQITGVSKVLVKIPKGAEHYDRAGFVEFDEDNPQECTFESLHIHPGGLCRILWRAAEPQKERSGNNAGDDTELWWCIVVFDAVPTEWVLVRNDHNDPAPPYGVFEAYDNKWTEGLFGGREDTYSQTYLSGIQPTRGTATRYVVNGPVSIAPGKYTYCHDSAEGEVWVALSGLVDAPAPKWHDNWGPSKGLFGIGPNDGTSDKIASFGFELQTDSDGHLIRMNKDGFMRRVLCRRFHPSTLQVKIVSGMSGAGLLDSLTDTDSQSIGVCQVFLRSGHEEEDRFVVGWVTWLFWASLEGDTMAQVVYQPYAQARSGGAYDGREDGYRWNVDHASCGPFPGF